MPLSKQDSFAGLVLSLDEVLAEFETLEQEQHETGTTDAIVVDHSIASRKSSGTSFSTLDERLQEQGEQDDLEWKSPKSVVNHFGLDTQDLVESLKPPFFETEEASSSSSSIKKKQHNDHHSTTEASLLLADLESTRQELELLKEENEILGQVSDTFSESFREETLYLQKELDMAKHTNGVVQNENVRVRLSNKELLDRNERMATKWNSLKNDIDLLLRSNRDSGSASKGGQELLLLREQIDAYDAVVKMCSSPLFCDGDFELSYRSADDNDGKRDEDSYSTWSSSSSSSSSQQQGHNDEEDQHAALRRKDMLLTLYNLLVNSSSNATMRSGTTTSTNAGPPPPRVGWKEFSARERPEGMESQDVALEEVLRRRRRRRRREEWKEFSERERPEGREFQDAVLKEVLRRHRCRACNKVVVSWPSWGDHQTNRSTTCSSTTTTTSSCNNHQAESSTPSTTTTTTTTTSPSTTPTTTTSTTKSLKVFTSREHPSDVLLQCVLLERAMSRQ